MEEEFLPLGELFRNVVRSLCRSYQYPDLACAKIVFKGSEYKTDNFQESRWRQCADITVCNQKTGTVEVVYLAETPPQDEGPFLNEERSLLNAVTERLGKFITRKRAEEALRESEEKFRVICDSAFDAVIMMDSDGKAVYCNQSAKAMFGYSDGEMMGRNIHDAIMPERYRAQFEKGFKQFTENGTGNVFGKVVALTANRKNGSEFPIEIALAPIQIKKQYWASAVIRDISERKQL